MRILIVTPTLGERQSIIRTVESVKPIISAYDSLHILVGPSHKLAWIYSRFPHLEIIDDTTSSGIYQALNRVIALKLFDYDYFAYINDDDFWLPAFSVLISEAIKSDRYSMIIGRVLHYNSTFGTYQKSSFFPIPSAFPALYKYGCPFITQQAVLFRAFDVLKYNGFNTLLPISADSDLISRIIESGSKVKLIDKVVSCYDISPNDRLSNNQFLADSDRHYFDKASSSQSLASKLVTLFFFRLYNIPLYFFRMLKSHRTLNPFL